MSGFIVQGPKSDDRDSSGLKNGLYPKTNYLQKLAGGEAARAIVVCAAGSGGARACGVFREQVHLATRW